MSEYSGHGEYDEHHEQDGSDTSAYADSGDGAAAAKRYAARLHALFEAARRAGATQADLARAVHWSETAVSRYLSGSRIGGRKFVEDFATYLGARGHPIPEEQVADLHALRRTAQQLSDKHVNQLLFWREEVERLRTLARAGDAELTEARRRLGEVRRERDALRARAETSERERDALRRTEAEQGRQLVQASRYIRQITREHSAQQLLTEELQREVRVLRRQVERLRDEPVPAAEEAVSLPPAFLPTFAAGLRPAGGRAWALTGSRPGVGLRVAGKGTQVLGVGGLAALLAIGVSALPADVTPGMDYGSGAKPEETHYMCATTPGGGVCSGADGWRWELPADGPTTTTFTVAASDTHRKLRGSLQLDGSEHHCGRAAAHWRISVGGTVVGSGDLTAKASGGWKARLVSALSYASPGGPPRELTASLPSGAEAATFTVWRTDTASCRAGLQWADAGAVV